MILVGPISALLSAVPNEIECRHVRAIVECLTSLIQARDAHSLEVNANVAGSGAQLLMLGKRDELADVHPPAHVSARRLTVEI